MPAVSKASFVIAVPDLKSSSAFYGDVRDLLLNAFSWLIHAVLMEN